MKVQTLINIVFAIGIVVLTIYLFRECNTHEVPANNRPPDSTSYYKNKLGDTVAALKSNMNDLAIHTREADSIASVYKTKFSNLQSYVTAYVHGHTDLPPIDTSLHVTYKDTGSTSFVPLEIENVSQKFQSKYYHANVTIDMQHADSSKMQLQAWDTLTVLWERKTQGPFFHRQRYIQISANLANPDLHVYGLKAYRIADPKPKRFGIGIQAGYGFSTGFKPQAYIGIGISYNLIRF